MFKRRLMIFLMVVGVGLAVMVGRLGQLQLLRGGEAAARAEASLRRQVLLGTTRGQILDRHGRILALDQACSRVAIAYRPLLAHWVVRRQQELSAEAGLSPEEAAGQVRAELEQVGQWAMLQSWIDYRGRFLADQEGLDQAAARQLLLARIDAALSRISLLTDTPLADIEQRIDQIVRRVGRVRQAVGMPVAEERQHHGVVDGLDESTAQALRTQLAELIDLTFVDVQPSTQRLYPFEELACHVIGRVGQVSAENLDDDPFADDPLRRYRDGDTNGKSGVERLAEATLRGRRGERITRTTGEQLSHTPAEPGQDVRISLDIELQRRLTARMMEEKLQRDLNGAAVVIHVPTGEILSAVSIPTYDLNRYGQELATLVRDEANLPLLHRAVASEYPPGSTVKPFSGITAVANGVLGVHNTIHCRGYLHTPSAFRCWAHARGFSHGDLDLTGAIKNSCNIYFYEVGEQLGAERLLAGMGLFGLGERPGTGLAEEKPGLLPTRQWLWRRFQRGFTPADGRLMAIGQSMLRATPLQIADAYATLARGGVRLGPTLVVDPATAAEARPLDLPPEAVSAAQQGMYEVVNDRRGTAVGARHETITICGKTGTAQMWPMRVDSNENGRIDSDDQIVRSGDTVWFVGYAPRDNPKVAFAVVLEYVDSGGGGDNCGPIGRDLVEVCRELGYIR